MLSRKGEAMRLDPLSESRDVLGKVIVPYATEEMRGWPFE